MLAFYATEFLTDHSPVTKGSSHKRYDLDSYLVERKQNPTRDIVIGNDAGDADSIISAICLAFVEGKTPIVPVTRDEFVYARPEVESLLQLAGISNASTKLLFIEDLTFILQKSENTDDDVRRLTLVDHNTINDSLHKFRHMFDVVEIVDHHQDEKRYSDVSGKQRNIAFKGGKALTASTTTLVAEIMLQQTDTPSPSMSTLLLGVILLDSFNLDESFGKVTSRDRDAVSRLLSHTDWSKSGLLANSTPSNELLTIDTNELYNHIQYAKYSLDWHAFSVERGLGYDYKAYTFGRENAEQIFGISSILTPIVTLMEKEEFILETLEFMRSKGITFLGIMSQFTTNGSLRRQLAVCSYGEQWLGVMMQGDRLASRIYKELDLKEVDIPSFDITSQQMISNKMQVHLYDQVNIKPSRKQIGPLLVDYFNSRLDVDVQERVESKTGF